jgi:hypothetical protein
MAKQYDTWSKTKDDITVTVSKAKDQTAGGRLKAFFEWLHEQFPDPGYGKPEGGRLPPRPDQGLPGSGARPDQGLPGSQPGPDNTLPGQGGRPDNSLPGSQPGPDNTLPGGQGGRPDNSLPGSQPGPDQGLPGEQPGIDNTLPKENLDEIVKLILGKCTSCEVAQPKK